MLHVIVNWIPFVPVSLSKVTYFGTFIFFTHADLETLKSQGLHSEDVLGTIGPFKIFLGSLEALLGPFEIPDEVIFYFFKKIILFKYIYII